MSRHAPGPARRTKRVLLLLVGALLIAVPVVPRAGGGLERVGTLAVDFGEEVVPDAATRRLIGIAGGLSPLAIEAFDGDRLGRLARVDYPEYWPPSGGPGRPKVWAFDETGRRLYVVAYGSDVEAQNFANPLLLVVDADSLKVLDARPLATLLPPGVRIFGAQLVGRDRLSILGQLTIEVTVPLVFPVGAPRAFGAVVLDLDLSRNAVVWGPVAVAACQSLIATRSQAVAARTDDAVFVGCGTVATFGVPAPGVPSVVEVDVADPTVQTVHPLPGSYAGGDVYFDARAGRFILVGASVGRPAQAAWVFDARRRVFLGQVAAGDLNVLGAGVNPATGRLYVGIDHALLVSSDRGIEIPQAVAFGVEVSFGSIVPVPFNDLLLVPTQGPSGSWVAGIYRDDLPADTFSAGQAVDFGALDALRVDRPQFGADLQAFGVRVHELGGLNAMLQNVFPQRFNYWRDVGNATGFKDGDRNLYFARVLGAHLSQSEATASAIAAGPDANTDQDVKTLGRYSGGAVGGEWPFEVARCGDFGSSPSSSSAPGAATRCDHAGGRVEAGASHEQIQIPGVVTVGATVSETSSRLDPRLGLVAEARAEARDLAFGPALIGRVISRVSVRAFGRAGTARASYERSFENVRAGDFTCATDCDPSAVAAALSATLGAQVRVELPAVDLTATKGGAHAHALREAWQHQQDVVLNNQDPTELQVPALRLTYIGDNAVASRLMVEVAAAKADATYLHLVPAASVPPAPAGPGTSVVEGFTTVLGPQPVVPRRTSDVGKLLKRVVGSVGHGVKVLFGTGARAIGVWVLFGTPVFLALRRRQLLFARGSRR